MANLRDKLRDREPGRSGAGARVQAAKKSAKGGKKPLKGTKKTESAPSLMGGLDVNRRLLFISIGIAAVAGLITVTYLSDIANGILGGGDKVKVWVTTENLPARKQLDDSVIKEIEVPKVLLPEGALTDEKDVVGKITLAPVVKNEILHKARVSDASKETGVAPKLRDNELGFLYTPPNAQDLALVKPDDYVDLTATIEAGGRWLSTKVLQRVRVLSVGNRYSNATPAPGSEETSQSFGDLITLAVPSSKVALLQALKQQGNLSMALREAGNTTVTPPEVSEADLARYVLGKVPPVVTPRPVVVHAPTAPVYHPPAPRPHPAVPHPQPPQHHGIEVYNGTQLIHKK